MVLPIEIRKKIRALDPATIRKSSLLLKKNDPSVTLARAATLRHLDKHEEADTEILNAINDLRKALSSLLSN